MVAGLTKNNKRPFVVLIEIQRWRLFFSFSLVYLLTRRSQTASMWPVFRAANGPDRALRAPRQADLRYWRSLIQLRRQEERQIGQVAPRHPTNCLLAGNAAIRRANRPGKRLFGVRLDVRRLWRLWRMCFALRGSPWLDTSREASHPRKPALLVGLPRRAAHSIVALAAGAA